MSFQSRLTARAAGSALIPLAVGMGLIGWGISASGKLAPGDGTRAFFVMLPIGMGALILATLLWAIVANVGQHVSVKTGGCTIETRGRRINAKWESLDVVRSRTGIAQALLVSDGARFVYLLDLFYPDFEAMAKELETRAAQAARRRRREVELG